eukprot:CAMPEP_0181042556 /NCGR_PEP_ID=MMETSP1070-20121207/12216_1 /TAXON_ID=265543 /ORGANISM="Minutocellus polymorphus, Strain NH13" /LENGTH=303 /DNA_ID=CAMNT_0023120783 /DNA_START=39 /DNA_END=949 /DNA_ORIENTATION=-
MAPSESNGLLEVTDRSESSDPQLRGATGGNIEPIVLSVPSDSWQLASLAAITVVLKSSSRHKKPLSPEVQIALLDAITKSDTSRSSSASLEGCKSTLLLMRHCEKRGKETSDSQGNEHCSDIGYQRAEYIPTLFGDGERWPLPKKMYAMSKGRPGVHHLNYREIETLSPLKEKSGVGINTKFTAGLERDLAADFFSHLAHGKLCGATTIVNWKHSRIPSAAMALGCGRDQGCPRTYKKKEFDEMWQIEYRYSGTHGDGASSIGDAMTSTHNNARQSSSGGKKKGHWAVSGSVVSEGFRSSSSP